MGGFMGLTRGRTGRRLPRSGAARLRDTVVFAALATALVVSSGAPQAAAEPRAQDPAQPGISLQQRFKYTGGTDLDFRGKTVYAGVEGAKGGVGIYRLAKDGPSINCKKEPCPLAPDGPRSHLKKIGFLSCPGSQNDVLSVSKSILALAYHESQCTKTGAGVALFNVKNPKRPKLLDDVALPGGTHTISLYPGKPIIYASPGGLLNGGGVEQILDISNPKKIKVAATFKPNEAGCHDITWLFKKEEKLAFCPGLSGTEIWNVAKPLKPVMISHIYNPVQDFHHYALPTKDGNYLVVSDENFELHDCTSGQSPTGAFFVYDITVREAPIPVAKFSPQRGAAPVGGAATPVCTSHQFNFVPGTDVIVTSWYTGGTSIIDFSDPLQPQELAFYQPADANTWSSYHYKGRILASDLNRGLEVLGVAGIKGF
jgi:hypothetical protein